MVREIPFNVNVLRLCRCRDCDNRRVELDESWWCAKGISINGGVVWATGEVAEVKADAWHYCLEYDGPQESDDCIVLDAREKQDKEARTERRPAREVKVY